jgi:hypothetical protein
LPHRKTLSGPKDPLPFFEPACRLIVKSVNQLSRKHGLFAVGDQRAMHVEA